jgi:hypothetical protein
MEVDPRFLSPKGENLSPKRENPIAVERFATRGERFVVALGRDPTRDARYRVSGGRYLTRRARFPITGVRDPA